jgi:transposase InsO family protein
MARTRAGIAANMEGGRGVRREVERGAIMTVNWLKPVLFVAVLVNAGHAQTSRPGAPVATQPAGESAPQGLLARPGASDDGDDWSEPFGGRQRRRSPVSARTHDGRPLRMLTLVDEFTRECLAIDVARQLNSEDVLERLAWLFVTRAVPAYIRSDNGPEFTAKAVREWLHRLGVQTLFIEPGSPWENGYVESFNGQFRDELLNREIFYSLTEAKVLMERWRREYNTVRPHSALGYRPPAPETIAPAEPCFAPLCMVQLPQEHVKTLT